MERHIVDAVRILHDATDQMTFDEPGSFAAYDKMVHAIKYLVNPDRFQRPKRGPSNVKGGKQRAKRNG